MVGNMQRQTQKHKKGFPAAVAVSGDADDAGAAVGDDDDDGAPKRNSCFIALSANQVFSRG